MYEYKAIVTAVYDADTITVDVDLGFNSWLKKIKVRLYGIDAPEMRGIERAQGIVARDWLRGQILNKEIVLKSHDAKSIGTGKYGRWLGTISLPEKQEMSLNEELVKLGFAEFASY